MPQSEYIQTIPIGFDDPEKARFVSRLIRAFLQSPGIYRTNATAFKDAFIFGTAIFELGWETKSRRQVVQNPVFQEDESGNELLVGFEQGEGEVVYRDSPMLRQVDIFDFYPDPSGTRIQEDMLGVAKRFRISKHQALRMADAGIWKRSAVNRAIEITQTERKGNDDEKRFPFVDDRTAEKYGMLSGVEFWGESAIETRGDYARNRVITLLEGEHARSRLNPFLDGNVPFKEVVLNPIQGRFYGLAVAETIRFLQDSIDFMLMVHTDAADIAYRPVHLGAHAAGVDPVRFRERRANDYIECTNPDLVKPLQIDSNALQLSAVEYQQRKLTAREASGATNPLQSIPTSGRQTATEVSELVRLASQKVELMVQMIERDDYPWIGKTLHSRMRQFLSPERQEILAGERFPVTIQDIDFDADIRFVGVRQAQSQFQKAATLREAINVIGTNPGGIAIIPQLYERYLRDGLDIQDAEDIIQQAVQRIQQQRCLVWMHSARSGMAFGPG
jgi:hypothetical protein